MSIGTQFSDSSNEANIYPPYVMGYDQPSSSTDEEYGMPSYPSDAQMSYQVPYQMQGGFEMNTWVNLEYPIHVEAVGRAQEIYAWHFMDLGNLVEYGLSAPPPDWRDDLSWPLGWVSMWDVESTSKLDYEGVNASMGPSGSHSKLINHVDMIYEGWIDSRFNLVHKGVLILRKSESLGIYPSKVHSLECHEHGLSHRVEDSRCTISPKHSSTIFIKWILIWEHLDHRYEF
ncbi:hypothetical protein AAG906_005716 [Vitis piasezkii]